MYKYIHAVNYGSEINPRGAEVPNRTRGPGGGGGGKIYPPPSDLRKYWADFQNSNGVWWLWKICRTKLNFDDLGVTDDVTGQVEHQNLVCSHLQLWGPQNRLSRAEFQVLSKVLWKYYLGELKLSTGQSWGQESRGQKGQSLTLLKLNKKGTYQYQVQFQLKNPMVPSFFVQCLELSKIAFSFMTSPLCIYSFAKKNIQRKGHKLRYSAEMWHSGWRVAGV